jgi:DNA-binding response OmpR family regulator
MKKSILIIDDDIKLCGLLTDYLIGFGYHVKTAFNPDAGLRRLKQNPPDLVILDIMLPKMNGFDICKEIRKESHVPIIMLTARGEVADRVIGLELGADDYLPKPFEPRELVARIQSVLKRAQPFSRESLRRFSGLTIDVERQKVDLNGTPIPLTTNEFIALNLLTRNAGKVLDRDAILQELRGIDCDAFNRSVDITMSRLRQKLNDDPKNPVFIKTVWGTGYVFIGADSRDGNHPAA